MGQRYRVTSQTIQNRFDLFRRIDIVAEHAGLEPFASHGFRPLDRLLAFADYGWTVFLKNCVPSMRHVRIAFDVGLCCFPFFEDRMGGGSAYLRIDGPET